MLRNVAADSIFIYVHIHVTIYHHFIQHIEFIYSLSIALSLIHMQVTKFVNCFFPLLVKSIAYMDEKLFCSLSFPYFDAHITSYTCACVLVKYIFQQKFVYQIFFLHRMSLITRSTSVQRMYRTECIYK